MRPPVKKRKRGPKPLILSHLRGIKRALLEGEKRPAFLGFLRQNDDCINAGKASDLPRRLDQHLSDRHAESWDEMTMFFLSDSADIAELEGLIVASANPPGNKQRPQVGTDKWKELRQFLKQDAMSQIDQLVYPRKKEPVNDVLSGRITPKKLKSIKQAKLASVLGINQGRVSQLVNAEPNHYSALRKYIQEAGRRDSVLLLLQKEKVD